jgi:hypothetical protein
MKNTLLGMLLLATPLGASAQIADPVASFRSDIQSPEPIALMKWEADLNGDGKKEVMLSRKDEFDLEIKAKELSSWIVYFAQADGFVESKGIQDQGDDALGVGVVPMINLDACYVGFVAEIGKHGIVTQQEDNPRVGDPIGRIYVYTLEGDHLVRTKLAEYSLLVANKVFDTYLKDGKRTVITPVEVAN